jgi:hypothetical protein
MEATRDEKEREIPKNRLLYDAVTLREMEAQYRRPFDIKQHVKTSATVIEIKTALRYWNGGHHNWQTSERVWNTCQEIDRGNWTLTEDNEVTYA